jgi:MerR HTH family regulatory protein
MLILPKKKSSFQGWYQQNKARLSEKRKKQYRENAEYRKRRVEASRRYRRGETTPSIPPVPPDSPISFKEAADRVGIGVSTLREWLRKKYFPDPKRHNRCLWFMEKQLPLLAKLKECLRKTKMRPEKIKQARLKEVRAFIAANWN